MEAVRKTGAIVRAMLGGGMLVANDLERGNSRSKTHRYRRKASPLNGLSCIRRRAT